jgi:photosystem II stability/assembly factor-like uncharacterized protein
VVLLRILALALASSLIRAQAPPVPTAETVPPTVPKPVYRYVGKPIAIEATCGEAEISEYGLSCTEGEPCPVYLELAAAESADSKLFVSGNLHAGTATLWSILLSSEDNGQSWTEPFGRVRGVALDQIQFPGVATGFVAGHTAGPLAKDPFFLRTTDGGKNWSRLPLFEDGAVGLIEQFHFESATRGTVGVDRGRPGVGRYTMLETESGGESWAVRQSAAVRVPGAPRESTPLVRILADAGSKSFRIEQRENAVWRTAAAFSVAAGVCRSEPGIAAPEPPPGQLHY